MEWGTGAAGNELEPEIKLSAAERKIMAALEERLRAGEKQPGGVNVKVLPLPESVRLWITRRITKLFLKDVQDFFFDEHKRNVMEQSLRDRLDVGGGPFIVVAHSQGSMIAYHVLRQLKKLTVTYACSSLSVHPSVFRKRRMCLARSVPANRLPCRNVSIAG